MPRNDKYDPFDDKYDDLEFGGPPDDTDSEDENQPDDKYDRAMASAMANTTMYAQGHRSGRGSRKSRKVRGTPHAGDIMGDAKPKRAFVSTAQQRKCWVLYRQAKARGETPKWDCREFASPPKPSSSSSRAAKEHGRPKYRHKCGAPLGKGKGKCTRVVLANGPKQRCWQHSR